MNYYLLRSSQISPANKVIKKFSFPDNNAVFLLLGSFFMLLNNFHYCVKIRCYAMKKYKLGVHKVLFSHKTIIHKLRNLFVGFLFDDEFVE